MAHIIIVHPKSTLALALRVRDDTGPSSARAGGTGEASGGVSGGKSSVPAGEGLEGVRGCGGGGVELGLGRGRGLHRGHVP